MGIRIVTPPQEEPVSLAEIKTQLRVDHSDEDVDLDAYIKAVRQTLEEQLSTAIMPQTLELVMDAWPHGRELWLPRAPLISVESIIYTDEEGNETPLDNDAYLVDAVSKPGRVVLKRDQSWPAATLQEVNGIVVTFQAGYTTVPEPLVMAIKLFVGHYYENREATTEIQLNELPFVMASLRSYDMKHARVTL